MTPEDVFVFLRRRIIRDEVMKWLDMKDRRSFAEALRIWKQRKLVLTTERGYDVVYPMLLTIRPMQPLSYIIDGLVVGTYSRSCNTCFQRFYVEGVPHGHDSYWFDKPGAEMAYVEYNNGNLTGYRYTRDINGSLLCDHKRGDSKWCQHCAMAEQNLGFEF